MPLSLRDVAPELPAYLIDGLIPVGHISFLYGPPGAGKTTLALAFAVAVAAGVPVLGRSSETGSVVWLDAEEMTGPVIADCGARVARGLNVPHLPATIFYERLEHPLTSRAGIVAIQRAVRETAAALLVVDSFGEAAAALDQNDAALVTPILRQLRQLGTTVLVVDHVAKPQAASPRATSPLGSVAKLRAARSALLLERNRSGLILTPKKAQFCAPPAPIIYETLHQDDIIAFRLVTREHPATASAARVLATLDGPKSVDTIASETSIPAKTVRNRLSELRGSGLAIRQDSGLWTRSAPASDQRIP